jgi:hypothetical protein
MATGGSHFSSPFLGPLIESFFGKTEQNDRDRYDFAPHQFQNAHSGSLILGTSSKTAGTEAATSKMIGIKGGRRIHFATGTKRRNITV